MPFDKNIRFAHMSDCHLGVWGGHPELSGLALKAFEDAVSSSIERKIDFFLVAGDLFDSSMPGIDVIRFAVVQLKRLVDAGVRVYAIAGSHDFSPTGKTMLNVFDDAGLLKNVHMKTAKDESGAVITGIEGRKGGLDRELVAGFDSKAGFDDGFKIFMFHSAITEYGNPAMESMALSALPKGFDYYAAGHVHVRLDRKERFGRVIYPGPIFPADFTELEGISNGSFCIVNVSGEKVDVESVPLKMADVGVIEISGAGKEPKAIEAEFVKAIESADVTEKILLLKTSGTLKSGKPSELDWRRIEALAKAKGAFSVKRSFHLEAPAQAEIKRPSSTSVEGIERELAAQVAGKSGMLPDAEMERIFGLMAVLSEEKGEGETNMNFGARLKSAAAKLLGIEFE